MNPYTFESIAFGLQTGIINIDENGKINSNSSTSLLPKLKWNTELEPTKCLQRAAFLGRWFRKLVMLQPFILCGG